MFKPFLIATAMFFTFATYAQPQGYKAVTDKAAFEKSYAAAAEKTTSIRSDFKQEKNLSMLSEKINSSGVFLFKAPNRVRMEYTSPYKYLMVINNDKILIQDRQKKKVYSAGDNKAFKSLNSVIMECVQGRILSNKSFKPVLYENKTTYCLDLTPQSKELKQLFSSIRLVIAKNNFSIDEIEMRESSGDNTVITFTNKRINAPVQDAEVQVN
ncbi:outer membrane lipoprotein carrier protein LolA [Hymenobacter sp. ASUV-10]|uniref:Outer membrane lipoprotein carrier protein LolA n=1 Tax=Hymenobacter aranciens TaxID=3063996 RepID=A0ABT9BC14_9BACT|nr:outer membrane lipoprotein carrier protein LolA [Hymenobacter sp. ASUV-10]MDO7875810.1 outer membrane lipoprotein carrier protein LolA [Hymenobacter sp. ASUV-10]